MGVLKISKKGVELKEQVLDNISGGWHIYYLLYILNGPGRGYHGIYNGYKVGETVKTEDKTLQEAERIGLNLKDRKRHGRRGYGHRSVVK